jgi:DNA-binding NarL/FixJ family response regulator
MDEGLIGSIYEAAFNDELWSDALSRLSIVADADAASLLVLRGFDAPPDFRATAPTREALGQYVASGGWRDSARAKFATAFAQAGFVHISDHVPKETLALDPTAIFFQNLDLDEQLGGCFVLPTGEFPTFTFERKTARGRFAPARVEALNELLPHLSRAALISTRLGFERVKAAASMLEALRLPAAVLSARGALLTKNEGFDAFNDVVREGAYGRLVIGSESSAAMFEEAVKAAANDRNVVRSIPVRREEGHKPIVLHVVPLARTASEIFLGAAVVVLATTVGGPRLLADAALLSALFDLTPSEARLAVALAKGETVRDIAATQSITEKTARTYLERIFRKTGVRRQTELALLLNDASTAFKG